MRIYLKNIIVVFILIWTLRVFYSLVSSKKFGGSIHENEDIDSLNKHDDDKMEKNLDLNFNNKNKPDIGHLEYAAEIKRAYIEIKKLKEQNEKQQQEIARQKYLFLYNFI